MSLRLPLLVVLLLSCSSALAGVPAAVGSLTIFSPTSVFDFGAHLVGTPTTLSLGLGAPGTNTVPVQVTSVTLSSPSFTQTNTCPSPLAPGGSCPLSGTFTPTAPGPASATLSITCVMVLVPIVANFTFACDGFPHNVTLNGLGLLAASVPALDPALVGVLAMLVLAWGTLFLRSRRSRRAD